MSAKAPFSIDLGTDDPLQVGGWDQLEELGDDQAAQIFQGELDTASMYRATFASPNGRAVLNDLLEIFFKPDIIRADDPPGSFAPGIRQGQARVVKRILFMIEFANTGGGKLTGGGITPPEE